MKNFLLWFALVFPFLFTAQSECNQTVTGIPLVLCSETPNTINICEEVKTTTFYIENTTTFTATGILADILMQEGVVYVPGSVVGATESNISDLSHPVFSLANIPGGSPKKNFSIDFKVNCDVFNNPSGTQYKNVLKLNYTANSTVSSSTHQAKSYSVAEPALSIINITNQVYPGTIGDVVTRCVTITNQGLGYLTAFQLTENHGADITITGVDLNNITSQSASSMTLSFTAAQISAIGDGDGLFENGETITFCETVRIDACQNVASQYQTSWGCEGQNCQALQGGGSESANIIFPGTIPNIQSSVTSTTVQCLDNPFQHTLKLKNIGLGQAQNLKVDIYSSVGYGSGTYGFEYQYNQLFDPATVVVKLNGVVQPTVIDSMYIRNSIYNQGCAGPNPSLGYKLALPNLPGGDSLEISFEIQHCDNVSCVRDLFNGWGYQMKYRSVCNDIYNVGPLDGYPRTYITWNATGNITPANFADGETKRISYLTNGFAFNQFPNNGKSKWVVNIKKNSCFNIVGGVRVINQDGVTTWNSSKVEEYDSVIVAYFNGPRPFNPDNGLIELDLQANCSNCPLVTIDTANIPECSRPGGASLSTTQRGGGASIGLSINFIPDTTCSQVMEFSCYSFATTVSCPGCDSGLLVRDYEFIRHTRGNPDYNEDGQPDNAGKADHPEMRLDRAIFGDTIKNIVVGVMHFPAGSKWDLCYARANFDTEMDLLGYLTDTIEIYRGGNKYTSVGISPTITNTTTAKGQYLFDMSASKLIAKGDLPAGFLYQHGDSIVFKAYYRVVKNRNALTNTGSSRIIDGRVSMHVNDSVEPTRQCHRFYCSSYAMNLTIIPVTYYVHGNGILQTQSCDSIVFLTTQYYSLGDWYTNPGVNLFPREYRYFGTIDTITYNVPEGFVLSRSRYRELSHFEDGGSNKYTWTNQTDNGNAAWINLNALYPDTNKLIFDVESLYDGVNMRRPDESYYGQLEVTIKPTCETPRDVEVVTNLEYRWKGQYADSVVTPYISRPITFRYDAPKMRLQANNPNLFAINDTIAWTVRVSNLSNISNADNVWLADLYENTGVRILRVHNLTDGGLLPEVNGVYQIGKSINLTEKEYMVVADFSSCERDSMTLALGWDCPGYPDSIGSYICVPEVVTLSITPRLPEIQTTIDLVSDSIRLCDTAEYIVYMRNVFQGTAYDFNLYGVIPSGVTYIAGTSRVDYPYGSGFSAFPDPTSTAGILNWDFSTNVPYITTNGFHGIGDPSNNEIELRFKVLTDCDYTSGSKFNFYSQVVANCGDTISSDVNASTPLVIEDAIPPYYTFTSVDLFQITPCSGDAPITVTIANNGPNDFWITDSVTVELPKNITYQGNYVNVINGPNPSTLSIRVNALGNQELTWALPSGITVGDTSRFIFDVQGNADTLTCSDIPLFNVYTSATANATCSYDNSICSIKTITGDSTKNTFVLKSYPSIQNLVATSTANAPTGEFLNLDLDVLNTGFEIEQGYNTTFNVYQDVDANGVYTSVDTLIGVYSTTDSIGGFSALTHFNFTIPVSSGQACAIFVRLDSISSSCFCNSDIAYATVSMDLQLNDTIVCSNEAVQIGLDSINGYTYSWLPTVHLNNTTVASPSFSKANLTTTIDSLTYELTVDRRGCITKDTLLVEVYPLPQVNAGLDVSYCEVNSINLVGNTNTFFEQSTWSTIANSTGNAVTIADATLEATTIAMGGYGTIEMELSKQNAHCPSQTDTVVFTIYQQSVSSVSDIYLCNVPTTILNGTAVPSLPSLTTQWIAESGSPITFTDNSIIATNANSIPNGENFIYLESTNGVCPPHRDTMEINNLLPHQAILPTDTLLCEAVTLVVSGNSLDTANFETGSWSIDPGYITTYAINPINDTAVQLNNLTYGEQRVIWEVTSAYCPSSYDTMSVIVYQQSVSSTTDIFVCNTSSTLLNGNAIPNVPSLSTRWLADSGSPITFADSSVITTTASNIPNGENFVYLESTNGVCPSDVDTLEINNVIPHQAILPNDTMLCEETQLEVIANALNPANFESGTWIVDGNYNFVTLTVRDDSVATVNGLTYGEQRVIWQISSPYCPASYDTMSIIVYEQPTATASPLYLCDKDTATLSGAKYPAQAIPTWTKSSNSTISFNDSNAIVTFIEFINYGQSEIYLQVENGVCPVAYDTVEVINLIPHQAILPPDTSVCERNSFLLQANRPNPLNYEEGEWHIDPAYNPNLVVTSVNDSTAFISGLEYGENRVVWEIKSIYCLSDFDTMSIFVYETPQAYAMQDTGVCQQTQIPIVSSYYPSNATLYYWTADNTYAQPNTPTFNPPNSTITQLQSMNIGSYRLVWHVESGVCPIATDTLMVYNYPKPEADYLHTSPVICQKECVDFVNQSSVLAPDQIDGYAWYRNDTLVSNDSDPTICFAVPGAKDIQLIVQTNNGCLDTIVKVADVLVNPIPTAGFSYSPVECIKVDDMIFVEDASVDAINYAYDFGDGFVFTNANPNHYYSDTGIFNLVQVVSNAEGCTDTADYYLYVGIQSTVYIPNSFSPDGNGVNEVFRPVAYGIENYNLKVFNRWGDLIFETDNPTLGWDGMVNGKALKQDVYVWAVTYREVCSDDEVDRVLRGHVTLIK